MRATHVCEACGKTEELVVDTVAEVDLEPTCEEAGEKTVYAVFSTEESYAAEDARQRASRKARSLAPPRARLAVNLVEVRRHGALEAVLRAALVISGAIPVDATGDAIQLLVCELDAGIAGKGEKRF